MGECQSTSTLPRSSYAALDSGNRVLLRELAAVVNRLLSGEEMTLRKLIGPLFRSSGPDRSFHSSVRLRNCGSQPQCGGRTHAVSSDFESDPSTHPGLGHLDSGRFPHASELAVETSEPSPCRAPTATGGGRCGGSTAACPTDDAGAAQSRFTRLGATSIRGQRGSLTTEYSR
jgi:hypothetical protein